VLKNPPGTPANLLLIDQDVAYFRDAEASSPFRVISRLIVLIAHLNPSSPQVVNSLLTLQLNEANQITRHTEEWDHNSETAADDGFLGMFNEHRKRMTAAPTNPFMPKA
jgi:hypothetical protein